MTCPFLSNEQHVVRNNSIRLLVFHSTLDLAFFSLPEPLVQLQENVLKPLKLLLHLLLSTNTQN